MLMFICMLSIISGKFESRKFLVFQHLSSIVQIFHTQLNLSVEKYLITYSPAHSGFIRVIGNTETRQALFPTGTVGPQGFSWSHLSGTPVTDLCEG